MTRFWILAVVALMFSATTATSYAQPVPGLTTGVDMDPSGNTATSVGTIEAALSNVEQNTPVTIDIVVKGVPAPGLFGVGYHLSYDPEIVKITAATMTASDPSNVMQFSSPASPLQNVTDIDNTGEEDTDGTLRVDSVSAGPQETGDGRVTELTLECVGTGTSQLTLTDDFTGGGTTAGVLFSDPVPGGTYTVETETEGSIGCGVVAETPEPGPGTVVPPVGTDPASSATDAPGSEETAAPTFTPSGTAPAGDTAVAVDVVADDNSDDTVGEVQACARAEIRDVFTVDIVIEDVAELIAWEALISYDPAVLEIVDRNAKLFLESSGGQALDASVQTPNTTGRYAAGAVDTADPLSPETGSGVLLRLTMGAVANGESTVSIAPVDVDNNGEPDRGLLLRNVNSEIIGDENGDALFDGPLADAEIRVGSDCEDADAQVVKVESASATADAGDSEDDDDDDGGSSVLPWIVGAILLLALGGGGVYLFMRRQGSTPTDGSAPPPATPSA